MISSLVSLPTVSNFDDLDLVWEDYQYFNGDMSDDLDVIVLVGKVIDRPLFGNEIEKRDKETR